MYTVEQSHVPYNFLVTHDGQERRKKINKSKIFTFNFLDFETLEQNSGSSIHDTVVKVLPLSFLHHSAVVILELLLYLMYRCPF